MRTAQIVVAVACLIMAGVLWGQSHPPIVQQQAAASTSAAAQRAWTPERKKVVPMEVIERFKLQPAEGTFAPYVLGYDGKPYSVDDVVDAIFQMTREHWAVKK